MDKMKCINGITQDRIHHACALYIFPNIQNIYYLYKNIEK